LEREQFAEPAAGGQGRHNQGAQMRARMFQKPSLFAVEHRAIWLAHGGLQMFVTV
jgi:hypothetical protein